MEGTTAQYSTTVACWHKNTEDQRHYMVTGFLRWLTIPKTEWTPSKRRFMINENNNTNNTMQLRKPPWKYKSQRKIYKRRKFSMAIVLVTLYHEVVVVVVAADQLYRGNYFKTAQTQTFVCQLLDIKSAMGIVTDRWNFQHVSWCHFDIRFIDSLLWWCVLSNVSHYDANVYQCSIAA